MVLGAATIFERVEWLHLCQGSGGEIRSGNGRSREGATELPILDAWVKAYSPGHPAALLRRLSWDGLTADEVRAALSLSRRDIPPLADAWTPWIDRYLDECRDGVGDTAPSNGALAPFAEIVAPAVRVARRELESRVPRRALDRFHAPAQRALASHLLKELAAQSDLLLFDTFRLMSGDEDAPGDGQVDRRYRRFVESMLAGGVLPLLQAYPVVARQFSRMLEAWVTATAELLLRLDADAEAITERFGKTGDVVAVDPALSDPHNGRRRVASLQFASGLTLVYKPRDLGLEKAFADLIRSLAALGLDPAPTAPALLARAGYGWIEFVRPEPVENEAAAIDWYRRAGSLLCLAHLLRGRDLHMENVIATSAGPVLIDLELLLQPVTVRERAHGAATLGTHRAAAGSCLATGFVSDLHTAADGTLFDVGGLRGDGRGMTPVSRRRWQNLGTDAIAFTTEPAFAILPTNRPTLAGEALSAEDYVDEVIEGFESTYRLVHEHREQIAGTGGPLAAFAGHSTRVIGRPTDQYAAMLHLLAAPPYQRSGALRSVTLDALNRAFTTAESTPPLWILAQEERRSLEALDVPIFHARTDQLGVYVGGRLTVSNHFAITGLDAVRDRIASMGDDDLAVQLTALQRALWDPLDARFATPLVVPKADGGDLARGTEVVTHALWIAAELTAAEHERVRDGGPLAHHYLYDGDMGPALFRAAIAATTGDERSRVAALDAVSRLDEALASDGRTGAIGTCAGDGSLIYALVCIARLLDDPGATATAVRVLDRLDEKRISRDDLLDVSGGAAGAAIALLALHAHTGDAMALARATLCGERLLETAQRHGGECAWLAADGRRYVGFAHGAAGIGVALTRLFRATGRKDFLAAAAGAHQFEKRMFHAAAGNWPVAAGDDGAPAEMMTAWCHGAPGLALARSLAAVTLQDSALLTGVTPALQTTAAVPVRLDDHLCCGSMGRCDVLLTAGEALRASASVEAAWRIALGVVRRAAGEGRYRLTSRGYEFRAFDPGFFRGLSGIGYQLLRLAAPSRLPSVLSFELPPVISRS